MVGLVAMMAKDWWMFAVRGIAAIVFGIAAFAWPEQTVTVLTWLFGLYLLVDGISLLAGLISGDPFARRNAWAVALMGIVSIGIGIASFIWTDAVALSLLYVIAFWAIVVGTLQVISAYQLRGQVDGDGWFALGGILAIVLGVLLVVYPAAGVISLVWLIAAWAIVSGVSSLVLAYRLRQVKSTLDAAVAA